MPARDYYQEAHQLASRLAEEGYGDWSKRLEDAIKDGFTATEILMGLRWQAKELQRAELPLTAEATQQVANFLAGLEEILS